MAKSVGYSNTTGKQKQGAEDGTSLHHQELSSGNVLRHRVSAVWAEFLWNIDTSPVYDNNPAIGSTWTKHEKQREKLSL